MLMNSNELMLSINKRLQDSGIIDDITDFLHEHSEYFDKCSGSDNIISSCIISIAMCCKPKQRQDANVFVTAYLGTVSGALVLLSDHSRSAGSKVELTRSINGEEVSRYVCD